MESCAAFKPFKGTRWFRGVDADLVGEEQHCFQMKCKETVPLLSTGRAPALGMQVAFLLWNLIHASDLLLSTWDRVETGMWEAGSRDSGNWEAHVWVEPGPGPQRCLPPAWRSAPSFYLYLNGTAFGQRIWKGRCERQSPWPPTPANYVARRSSPWRSSLSTIIPTPGSDLTSACSQTVAKPSFPDIN